MSRIFEPERGAWVPTSLATPDILAGKERLEEAGMNSMKKLEELKFDNLVLKELPIDPEKRNFTRQVSGACFSIVDPTPIEEPELVAASNDALAIIHVDPKEIERKDFPAIFCGNEILKGARPAAHCYCGHQFGYFSGQLGDGATMFLGQIVLRSSIREFLCSEAMAGLGIPTTRAPSIVTSRKSKVIRDIFYDGNTKDEQCTVITRLAPTFLRFGSFEIVKPMDPITNREGPSAKRADILEALLTHTIQRYFPKIWKKHEESKEKEDMYLDFYIEVVTRTASLVALWQAVGWCHGVLNTDNMSIIGLTIDYGPYGFMEKTDPDYACNDSDNEGRYSYKNQPAMCKFNCEKLAEALQLLLPLSKSKKALEDIWDKIYEESYYENMGRKLGLNQSNEKSARDLIDSLLETMSETSADFSLTFRTMSEYVRNINKDPEIYHKTFLEGFSKKVLATQDEIKESLKISMPIQQLQMIVMMARQQPALLNRFPQVLGDLKKLQKIKSFQETPEEKRLEAAIESWKEWLVRYRTLLTKQFKATPYPIYNPKSIPNPT
ncbi:hypothetical protein AAMO2058_000465400 [Amorphochlora amoebiformis]